jgi:hypothetical protein
MSDPRGYAEGRAEPGLAGLCRAGGVAAFVLLAYSLATLVQMVVLGGPPTSATEAFEVLRGNRLVGLLRLDLPTALALPLYYLLFLGFLAALRRADDPRAVQPVWWLAPRPRPCRRGSTRGRGRGPEVGVLRVPAVVPVAGPAARRVGQEERYQARLELARDLAERRLPPGAGGALDGQASP